LTHSVNAAASLSSISLNYTNELLAASNTKGLISFFPTADLQDSLLPQSSFISENSYVVAESGINQVQFSMLERNLVGAACDTCCALFDTQTSKQILSFPRQCQ
jgi:WD40 repeat protein